MRKAVPPLQYFLTVEKTLGKDGDADQHCKNGENSGQNAHSAAEEIACCQYWKVIKVQDNELLFDEIGSNECSDQNDADQSPLKMSHDQFFELFRATPPVR